MENSEKESDIVVCMCYICARYVPIYVISNKNINNYIFIFLIAIE